MSKSEPRNVEDVPYVESADLTKQRPMREVLAERKRLVSSVPRAIREEAYRERAGMIAELQSCLCGYPIRRASTESGHEEWCPTVGILISRQAAKETRRR